MARSRSFAKQRNGKDVEKGGVAGAEERIRTADLLLSNQVGTLPSLPSALAPMDKGREGKQGGR